MCELLARSGVDVQATDIVGYSALHRAVWGRQGQAADVLLEHGAKRDIYTASGLGDVASVTAYLDADPEAVSRADRGRRTPLHWAAAGCRAGVMRLLIARGALLDATEVWDHQTPLMVAASSGCLEAVQVLLQSGADASLCDDRHHTAGELAEEAGHSETAAVLREHDRTR